MSKKIVNRETRFVWWVPTSGYEGEDYHFVKEQVTYDDGTTEPRRFLVENFERPVWVDRIKDYKEKKEFQDVERLIRKDVTQKELNKAIAGLLQKPYLANDWKALKDNPYVYGSEVTSTSLIKYRSLRKNNMIQSPYTLAVMDLETTTCDDKHIHMSTITFGNKVIVSVMNSFLERIRYPKEMLEKAIERYLPKYAGKLDLTFTTHDSVIELLKTQFSKANEWSPDFLAFWNIDFDMGTIQRTLERHNVPMSEVIPDQTLPIEFRRARYKKGPTKQVTASGKVKPINPSSQWHTLEATSTFYAIDAMCVYRFLRAHKPELPSYSLDYVLGKEGIGGKLRFTEADHLTGEKWHNFMQDKFPIEYIVYNIYDCLSIQELDSKTKDLEGSLPAFSGITDFAKFSSQGKKLADALFLYGMSRGQVIGSAVGYQNDDSDELMDEDDLDDPVLDPNDFSVLGLKGWIQLLPQSYLIPDGLKVLKDFPDIKTSVRGMVFDMDCTSSYPSDILAMNVSKATTKTEVIDILGMKKSVFTNENLGLVLGPANSLRYFETMFDMPSLEEVDDLLELPKYRA